jgi:hypothetical protein
MNRRVVLPSGALRLGEGFVIPSRWRTLTRWQLALPGRAEYPLLLEEARRNAGRRPPNPHRMLLAVVRRIDADLGDGRRAVSQMTPREVEYCRRCFAEFSELVFACTGGALRIEATELVLEEPARRMSSTGNGRHWLSAADAFAGRESIVPPNELDSLAVYYKMPSGLTAGLHGGAVGRDRGVQGSAYFTLWITDWTEAIGPFNRTVIASLHEWLHNVSFYAHRVMGETAIPDCHAGEEHGYWDTDGGYPQWQAWNRDLMLRYMPRGFWYRLTSRGPLLPPDDLGPLSPLARAWKALIQRRPRPVGGRRFFSWHDVEADWMRALPQLSNKDLRRITGLKDLMVTLHQPGANTHVVWSLRTSSSVDSPFAAGDPLTIPPALDNVLSLGRRPSPGPLADPVASFVEAPLESMAWLRSPRAPRDRRDLILLRPDLASWILPRLRGVGRRAEDSIAGYLARRDPSEGQRVNLLVLAVDFGENPPGDELEACGA